MSRQVIVLGNHRTGSSCLAGVLNKLGVPMGYQMLGPHPSNPSGHYEDRAFLTFNDTVVGKWYNPKLEFEEGETKELQKTLEGMIFQRNCDWNIWGLKDPRLCILLPLYLPLLNDLVILHIVRNYDAAINSLAKREKWNREKAEQVLDIYTDAKARALKQVGDMNIPVTTIHFESLVEAPVEIVDIIVSAVFDRYPDGLQPSSFMKKLAASFVNKEFVHHG